MNCVATSVLPAFPPPPPPLPMLLLVDCGFGIPWTGWVGCDGCCCCGGCCCCCCWIVPLKNHIKLVHFIKYTCLECPLHTPLFECCNRLSQSVTRCAQVVQNLRQKNSFKAFKMTQNSVCLNQLLVNSWAKRLNIHWPLIWLNLSYYSMEISTNRYCTTIFQLSQANALAYSMRCPSNHPDHSLCTLNF